MDPVLATSNDHGLQQPRTPTSTRRIQKIHTPVSAKNNELSDYPSSQKKSRFLSNTLKWFRLHSRARVGNEDGSPRSNKAAWDIFATIRSPKLENEEYCQDGVEVERPRTTSPTKTSRGTIGNDSSQPKRRRSLSDFLSTITKSSSTRRNTISRCSVSPYHSCLGEESMNHSKTYVDIPLRFSSRLQRRIPTPIPQDESGEAACEGINRFVSHTINVEDTFKNEQTERLSNHQKGSAYSSGSWKSQARTLGSSYTSLSVEDPESVIYGARIGTPDSWLQELIAAHDPLQLQEESSGKQLITSQRYHRDQQPIVTIHEVNPAWDLDIDPQFRRRLEQRTGRYQDLAAHDDKSPFLNEEEIAQSIKMTLAKMTKNVHKPPYSDEGAGDFIEISHLLGDGVLDFEKDEMEVWDAVVLGGKAMQETNAEKKKRYQRFPTIPSDDGTKRISPILEQSIAFRTPADDETVSDSEWAIMAKNTSFPKCNSIEDCRKPRPSVKHRYASVDPVFVKFPTNENYYEHTKIYSSKSSAISDLYQKNQGKFRNLCTFDPKGRIIHVYHNQGKYPNEEELDEGGLEVLWLPLNAWCDDGDDDDDSLDDGESEEIPEWYMSTEEDSISGDIDISRRPSLDMGLNDPLINHAKSNAAERQSRSQPNSSLVFDSSLNGKIRYGISKADTSFGCGMSRRQFSPSKDEDDLDIDDRSTLGFLVSQFSGDSDDLLSQSSKQASFSKADITRFDSSGDLVCHLGDVNPEVASPTRTWPELGRAYLQAHPIQSSQEERGDSDGESRKFCQGTCSTIDILSSHVSEVSKGNSGTNDDTGLNPTGAMGGRKGKGLNYDFVNAEYLCWACDNEQRKEFGRDFFTTEYPRYASGCSRPGPSKKENYFNCGILTEKSTEASFEDDPFTEHIEDISPDKRPIVASYPWSTKQNFCLDQDLAGSHGISQTAQSQSPGFGSAGSKQESWKIHLPATTKIGGSKSIEDALPTAEPSDPNINVTEAITPEQAGVEMAMYQAVPYTPSFRFTKYGKLLEKAESYSRNDLLVPRAPVTVEDLNVRAIGKAARNGSLSKKDKDLLAEVDVFQAQGLMPSSLGTLPNRPRHSPAASRKPVDRSVASLLPNVTPLALYGTACSSSEKKRVASADSRRSGGSGGSLRLIEQNLISPSPSSRACSRLSFAETDVSSLFGERLEKIEHY
ncbi:hypothetical protein B7494_g4901 [Chlorociboria aeruginascens]|nr:hypothetical protein B7494_g4901 [Chlorociboria aeruginascens]